MIDPPARINEKGLVWFSHYLPICFIINFLEPESTFSAIVSAEKLFGDSGTPTGDARINWLILSGKVSA